MRLRDMRAIFMHCDMMMLRLMTTLWNS